LSFLRENSKYKGIVMIGDSIADYVDLPNVSQFAVENATLEYKEKCTFISNTPFTAGVIESLKKI